MKKRIRPVFPRGLAAGVLWYLLDGKRAYVGTYTDPVTHENSGHSWSSYARMVDYARSYNVPLRDARARANPDGGEPPSATYQRIEKAAHTKLTSAVAGLTGAERKAAMRTARAEYDRVTDAAWDAFQRAIGNRRNPVDPERVARWKAWEDAQPPREPRETDQARWKREHAAGTGKAYPTYPAMPLPLGLRGIRGNPDDAVIGVGERVRVLTGDYYDQRSKRQIRHDGMYVVGVVASVTKSGQYNVDLLNGHQLRARASAVSRTKWAMTPAAPVRKSGLLLNPDLVGVLRTAPGPTYAVAWEVRSSGRVIRRGTAVDTSAARDDVEHEGVPRRSVMWDNGSGRLVAAP